MSTPARRGREGGRAARRRAPVGFSTWQVFRIPVWLGVLSAVGLLSALLGDDLWDLLSWLTLLAPLAVIAWYTWRPRPSPAAAREAPPEP